MKVANRKCRALVESRIPFEGSSLYGKFVDNGAYVVYSYGPHFPLFIHQNGIWYENSDRYSDTTARHRGQARPHDGAFIKLDTGGMKDMLCTKQAA